MFLSTSPLKPYPENDKATPQSSNFENTSRSKSVSTSRHKQVRLMTGFIPAISPVRHSVTTPKNHRNASKTFASLSETGRAFNDRTTNWKKCTRPLPASDAVVSTDSQTTATNFVTVRRKEARQTDEAAEPCKAPTSAYSCSGC